MYTETNFKTKKAIKEALKEGKKIRCYAPGLGSVPDNGVVYLEGPRPVHRWYAVGQMENGFLKSIK